MLAAARKPVRSNHEPRGKDAFCIVERPSRLDQRIARGRDFATRLPRLIGQTGAALPGITRERENQRGGEQRPHLPPFARKQHRHSEGCQREDCDGDPDPDHSPPLPIRLNSSTPATRMNSNGSA